MSDRFGAFALGSLCLCISIILSHVGQFDMPKVSLGVWDILVGITVTILIGVFGVMGVGFIFYSWREG